MKSFLHQNVSQDSLITLFSRLLLPYLLIGDDFTIHKANPQILELWGRDNMVIGKSLFEVLPEIQSQGFVEILNNIYRNGEVFKGNKWPVFLEKYGTSEEHSFNFIYAPYIMMTEELSE